MAERPPRRITLIAAICAAKLLISGSPAAAQSSNPTARTAPSGAPIPPPPQPEAPTPQTQPIGAAPAGLPFPQWPRATGEWFGLRRNLEDAGVMVNARLVADYSKVFLGGASPG